MSIAIVNGRRPRGAIAPPLELGNRRIAIWGQSNAEGRALLSSLSDEGFGFEPAFDALASAPFERVFIYVSANNRYDALEMGVNNVGTTTFGPELGIAIRWMQETSTGNLYLEKSTSSGARITLWDPVDNFAFSTQVGRRGVGNSWLAGQGVTIADDHWLWVQGESDVDQSTAAYKAALEEIIAERLVESLDGADSKIVLAQMLEGNAGYGANVAAAKSEIAAAEPNRIKLVTFIDSFLDSVHIDARGQLQLGFDTFQQLFGAAYREA